MEQMETKQHRTVIANRAHEANRTNSRNWSEQRTMKQKPQI